MEAIQNSGHAGRIDIGLDVAASEFYDAKANMYNLS
jgi:enolase